MISTVDLTFTDDALDGMVRIVGDLGGDLANTRLDLLGVNALFAELTHYLGVTADWGGQLIAGRSIVRDRDAEFVATGPVTASTDPRTIGRLSRHNGRGPSSPASGRLGHVVVDR